MRMQPRLARPTPHFFWQGLLIVLPALLLAGACLYSLRQDNVVAEHELKQEAAWVAEFMAQQFQPRILPLNLAWSIEAPAQTPEQDLIVALTSLGVVKAACLVGVDGDFLYPPPFGSLPLPAPLDVAELTPPQQDAWLALEASWSDPQQDARALFERFAASHPPERFTHIARFRTAVAVARSGQTAAAAEWLGTMPQTRSVVAESGIPIANLATLQLILWQPDEARAEQVNRLARTLIAEPSPMSDAIWDLLPESDPTVVKWLRVKTAHDRARELEAAASADPDIDFATVEDEALYLLEFSDRGKRWIFGVSLDALRSAAAEFQRGMLKPEHLEVAVTLGEQALLERLADKAALAEAAQALGGDSLEVEVFLKDPAAFYEQRRARAVRFAVLIGLSAVAVLIGFTSAWRAFRREQQLSEMKTNFVSSVSHELRAPIASVRLMAEELEQGDTAGKAKLSRYHRFIAQECRRLTAVIENVLDFARREQGRERFEFEATDLERLVSETVELLRPYGAERNVFLESVLLGTPEEIEADGHALQRALVNLVDNAIKHSPAGSSVTVTLEYAAERMAIHVEDHGPGIPSAEQKRIFERFYRIGSELQRETQGIGLGLSIVKHLAEVHGGRVLVRSSVGEGSRFTIELPMRRPAAAEALEPTV